MTKRVPKTRKELATDAAEALTDLNTFGAVISLMEGGHLYNANHLTASFRIIKIAKEAMQRCRRDFDKSLSNLERLP